MSTSGERLKETSLAIVERSGLNDYFFRKNRGRIKVLLFHRVLPDAQAVAVDALPISEFRKLLFRLSGRVNFVSLSDSGEFTGMDCERLNVLLTFDDGFEDLYSQVAPVLREHRINATVFVIADCVSQEGTPPDFWRQKAKWDEGRTLNASQLKELRGWGITIGSHSCRHRNFANLSIGEAVDDALESRKALSDLIGVPVSAFAFPWGRHRAEQLAPLGHLFARIFITRHGFASTSDRVICRNEVASCSQGLAAASGALDFFRNFLLRARV